MNLKVIFMLKLGHIHFFMRDVERLNSVQKYFCLRPNGGCSRLDIRIKKSEVIISMERPLFGKRSDFWEKFFDRIVQPV